MIISVSGAGSGKTTRMADIITEYHISEGKVVFCVAFTNAAANNIRQKVNEKLGEIPANIRISTIHSFLYQELINPFYYFLYDKHFVSLSTIALPTNPGYKNAKIAELEANNILHITSIPQKAMWVTYKKSGDIKQIKDLRSRIITFFNRYCEAIFVDEAQDINKEIGAVLCALDNAGVKIFLYGDPKQDIKGYGVFQSLIDDSETVNYISKCYRCPQKHLNLSNLYAGDNEKQIADGGNATGCLSIVFETDVENLKEYIESSAFELCYISRKHERFNTHIQNEKNDRFSKLLYEVKKAMYKKWSETVSDFEISRGAFSVTEKMLDSYDNGGTPSSIINHWVSEKAFEYLDNNSFAQMASAFTENEEMEEHSIVVRSIESIKGLEATHCLFILTTDLASYLFMKKTEKNKTRNLLYVALTRSRDNLTILITKEVEKQYSKEKIIDSFKNMLGLTN